MGYLDVSRTFFVLYTQEFMVWAAAVPGQCKKNNFWFYSQLQMNKTTAPSWLYQFEFKIELRAF